MFNKIIQFFDNFLGSLRDKEGSMSLKKLTSVGIFWVYAIASIRHTDKDNLMGVLGVHASLITALLITHSVVKMKTNNSDNNVIPDTSDNSKAGG